MGRGGEEYKYGWGGCGNWVDGEPVKNLGNLRAIVGSPMLLAGW